MESPDGQHIATVIGDHPRKFVEVDGHGGPSYKEIKTVVFTPDSRFVAYVAGNEGPRRTLENFFLVVLPLTAVGRTDPITFAIHGVGWLFAEVTPDGNRVMAVDRNNGKILLTVTVANPNLVSICRTKAFCRKTAILLMLNYIVWVAIMIYLGGSALQGKE